MERSGPGEGASGGYALSALDADLLLLWMRMYILRKLMGLLAALRPGRRARAAAGDAADDRRSAERALSRARQDRGGLPRQTARMRDMTDKEFLGRVSRAFGKVDNGD